MGGFGQGTPVEGSRRRSVGRPSLVAQYAPQLAQWLCEDPDLGGAEILRRLRLSGYRGGKSALYDHVRRLRVPRAATLPRVRSAWVNPGGQKAMILREDVERTAPLGRSFSREAWIHRECR